MRKNKPLRKSKSLIDDIKEISYILEDESYKIVYLKDKYNDNPGPFVGDKVLSIALTGGSKKFINDYGGWEKHLQRIECYSEYLSRLQDICDKHGYKVSVIGRDNGTFVADSICIFRGEFDREWRLVKMGLRNKYKYFEIEEFFTEIGELNESKVSISSIEDEIKSLSYILEDEGMICDLHETPMSKAFKEHGGKEPVKERYYLKIVPNNLNPYTIKASQINKKRLDIWKEEENVWRKKHKVRNVWDMSTEGTSRMDDYPKAPDGVDWRDIFIRDLLKNKSFLEYRDRVYDICQKNNLKCSRQSNGIIIEVK